MKDYVYDLEKAEGNNNNWACIKLETVFFTLFDTNSLGSNMKFLQDRGSFPENVILSSSLVLVIIR